jgi:4-hydroxybenzoate polyprenyltransferase
MLKPYIHLLRLDKPIGILLLLWPTLWALWLASDGKPNKLILSVFIAGVILMRSAGCVINDLADRHFDGHVKRTKERPLATGKITSKQALLVFFGLALCAFFLVLFLNAFTIFLAILGMLLTISYPFLKRITHLPQLGLGVAFSWGVLMAFAAEKNFLPATAWLVFLAALVWPVIYDTMYAMVDRQDDIKIGIKSTAILFGKHDKLFIGFLQMLFLLLMSMVGFVFELTIFYYASLVIVASCFVYQQWLIKTRRPEDCLRAFLHNQWVGVSIIIGIIMSY